MSTYVVEARSNAVPHLTSEALQALDDAVASIGLTPKDTAAAFRNAGKALGAPTAAMAVYDWGAEVAREAGRHADGIEFFKLARTKEQRVRIPTIDAASETRFSRFAAATMLDEETLVAHIKAIAKLGTAAQIDRVIPLIRAWLEAAGDDLDSSEKAHLYSAQIGTVSEALLDAVAHLGEVSGRATFVDTLLAQILHTLRRTTDPTIASYRAPLLRLLESDATHRENAADAFPLIFNQKNWRQLLLDGGVIVQVAARGPEGAGQWLKSMTTWCRMLESGSDAWLAEVITILAPVLRKLEAPLALGPACEPCLDPVFIDILLEHKVPLTYGHRNFNLYYWASRKSPRPLKFLAADPLGLRLVSSYNDFHHNAVVVDAVRSTPEVGLILDGLIGGIDKKLHEATLARLDQEMGYLKTHVTPHLLESRPDLRAVMGRIDLADMLARNFRGGVMDELGWPLQDAANDALSSDVIQYHCDGPFPYWVMSHEADAQIIVLGPEGEVYRAPRASHFPPTPRAMRYVDGDVLYFGRIGSLFLARWLSDPENTFAAEIWETFTKGVATPGGNVWEGGRVLRPGKVPSFQIYRRDGASSDGERFWVGDKALDPDTSEILGQAPPEWLAGPDVLLEACTYWPIPKALAHSTMGVRDCQWGIRVCVIPEGGHTLETLDERRWAGSIEGGMPKGLLRFPYRDRDVVYATHKGDEALWLADGSHPIIPHEHGGLMRYWAGAPQRLPFAWWHYLEPRDLPGSAALAQTTPAQTKALLDAGATALALSPDSFLSDSEDFAAVFAQTFPEVTHPRLRKGLAQIVQHALGFVDQIKLWQMVTKPTATGSNADANASPPLELTDADLCQAAKFFDISVFEAPGIPPRYFEQSIRRADQFLAEPGQPREAGEGYEASLTVDSTFPWTTFLRSAGAAVWGCLARLSSDARRFELEWALEVWAETSFAAAPEEFRLLDLVVPSPPAAGTVNVQAQSRYVLFVYYRLAERRYKAIERRQNGVFVDPDWATVDKAETLRGPGAETLRAVAHLYLDRGPVPFDAAICTYLSEGMGILPATAGLLWCAAMPDEEYYDDPDERELNDEDHHEVICVVLGIEPIDVELGFREFKSFGVDLVELYATALPPEPQALYTPFEPDAEGMTPVDRFIAAWREQATPTIPLDVDLPRLMLETLQMRSRTVFQHTQALMDPDASPLFSTDVPWVLRPWRGFQSNLSYMNGFVPPGWPKRLEQTTRDENRLIGGAFSGWVLRNFLQYMPWAHQELPFGHPTRAHLVRLAELIAERLKNPDLLLLAGAIDLSEETDPQTLAAKFAQLKARFEGAPYVAPDGGESADGVDRGDLIVTWPTDIGNSFFLTFRPQRVESLEAFAKFATDLGIYDVFHRTGGGCTCGLNFGNYPVVDITDLPSWLVWKSESFQAIIATLADEGPRGSYASDPRVTCPDLVESVATHHAISGNAATLYLQLATLAEPTDARLTRINGWNADTLASAEAELFARRLIVEGEYDGCPRRTYVPGPVIFPVAPALPLEASKLALYGLEPDQEGKYRAPFGVILPLKPLAMLFAEAYAGQKVV